MSVAHAIMDMWWWLGGISLVPFWFWLWRGRTEG